MTVGALFGEAARDYDRARRQLVPGFDRFYRVVLESIPFQTEQESGCSTSEPRRGS